VSKMPRRCPAIELLALLASKSRSAGIHLVLGTQRPDAEFMTGEMRDNFRCRVSLGRLSPQGAMMMWDASYIGVALPAGVRGRATAVSADGRPVEAQAFRTPDPRRLKDTDTEDLALLQMLRPTESTHPRLVIVPPEIDDEDPPLGYYDWISARLVLADTRPDLLIATVENRVQSSSSGLPHQRQLPAGLTLVPDPDEEVVDADESDFEVETLGQEKQDGYGEEDETPVQQLAPGDLVRVEGVDWAVVEQVEEDPIEEGYWCLDWRTDDDDRGSVSVPEGELVTTRHPVEYAEV
jgi:S-DNA-T family DNA segregation ATPase FtsK/SpoIIIE